MCNDEQRCPPSSQPQDGARKAFAADSRRFDERMRKILSLEVFSAPARWPKNVRPFLCLKNDRLGENGFARPGLLYDHPDHRTTVFDVNMYDIPAFGGKLATIRSEEAFLEKAYKTYASFQEMIDDGWVVDDWVID